MYPLNLWQVKLHLFLYFLEMVSVAFVCVATQFDQYLWIGLFCRV